MCIYIYIYIYIDIYPNLKAESFKARVSDTPTHGGRKSVCAVHALLSPRIPVSTLSVSPVTTGMMSLDLEDGMAERTQH